MAGMGLCNVRKLLGMGGGVPILVLVVGYLLGAVSLIMTGVGKQVGWMRGEVNNFLGVTLLRREISVLLSNLRHCMGSTYCSQ